jgi:hypothetical protein
MEEHDVRLEVLNPTDKATLRLDYVITCADTPVSHEF